MSSVITGQQKYENYKEQFTRMNRALTNGFNLEAIFIEYAIIEDRTESVLRHSDMWDAYVNNRKGRDVTLDSKIAYIRKLAENKKSSLHKYFSDDLLDSIITWKNERNRLIHALMKQQLRHDEIAEFARAGKEIVNLLRNKSGSFNRAADKKKESVK